MKIEKISAVKLVFFLLTTCYLSCTIAKVPDRMRIIGGKRANPNDFKYVVALLTGEDLCGGAVINEHYVLSAAHCFLNESNHFVRGTVAVAGTVDLYNYSGLEVEVENVFVPKSFRPRGYVDDIAVVKLKRSFNLQQNNLTKLHLPRKWGRNYIGRRASIAGFGASDIKFRNNKLDQSTDGNLYYTDVHILNETECEFADSANIFCGRMIGDERLDRYGLCFGDSGSPLVYKSRTVIGIASYGFEGDDDACNEKGFSMLYTKVSSYLDFIYNAVTGSDMTGVRSRNDD